MDNKTLTYKMKLQISCGVHAEVSSQAICGKLKADITGIFKTLSNYQLNERFTSELKCVKGLVL